MDGAYLPTFAALAGSVIGGFTSFASAWLTQRYRDRAKRLSGETTRHQDLYRQFIEEASKLYADALVHNQAEVAALVSIYALVSRMRVISSNAVIDKAEEVIHQIIETYSAPNKTFAEVRELINVHAANPLREFSEECRADLRALNNSSVRA